MAKIDLAASEARLLDEAVRLAPEVGWNARLVARCARACGMSDGEADLLLPHGARDLAALLARRHDERALAALASGDGAALKVRERIAAAVRARLDVSLADESALRRWHGFLALPPNIGLGLRLLWASADGLWRWAGDEALDENHYSKRALLAKILASTTAIALASGRGAAERHLERRIDQVMAFERWKARRPLQGAGAHLAARLGRLRYGARGSAAPGP